MSKKKKARRTFRGRPGQKVQPSRAQKIANALEEDADDD